MKRRYRRGRTRKYGRKRAKKRTFGKRVKSIVSRMEESKFSQSFGASTTILTGTPIFGGLAPILPQGSSAQQRIGNVITMYNLRFRAMLAANIAGCSVVRVMIVRDKQTNGAVPASPQVFFADSTAANSWYSGYNPTFVGPRFEVLMDKSKRLEITGGATDQGEKAVLQWRSRKPIRVTFNGNTPSYADIVKNGLILAAYTDVAVNGPFLTFELTYQYKDA